MSETMALDYKLIPLDFTLSEAFDVHLCNGFSLPSFAVKFLKEHSHSFEARDDDVFVVSYPKTGTTWTQEIVYLVNSNLDFDTAKAKSLDKRFPFIEHSRTNFETIENLPSPRLLKSHLPYSLLPKSIVDKKCKIIYITRNPKDVVVSYYHFACLLNETRYQGTFNQFFERFLLNRTTYSPFIGHNLEFWDHRNDQNILFLSYEDLHKDFAVAVQQIATFLGKPLKKDEITRVLEHCNFNSMSKSKSVGLDKDSAIDGKASQFFRKGKVGDWKNYLNEEQDKRMDEWIEKQVQGTGLQFTYEI